MSEDINYQIVPEGKIRDYIDGTIRKDTPEEYVRQTVEKRLVIEHKYPKQRIAVEYPIKMSLSSLLTKEKECRSLRPTWLHVAIACGACGLMASTKLFIRR